MPFNSSGVYTQVTGAVTAVAGQTIQSAVWNAIHADIGNSLTQAMQEFITQPSNRNIAWMNGGMEIWQRGSDTSSNFSVVASNTAYTVDRWYLQTGVNQASTVAAITPGLVNQSRIAARIRRTAAQTGTTQMFFAYPLDTDEIIRCRGKNVTLTFTVQAGANWSPTSGFLGVVVFTGTGASPAKRGGTPYTGEVLPINSGINLTPGGAVVTTAFSSSVLFPTNATQAEITFYWTPTGTAGAADDFTIDDVQLEVQNATTTWIPTVYDRLDLFTMLEGCKRHYQKTQALGTFAIGGCGRANALEVIANATSRTGIFWQYPVELRATATPTSFNPDGVSANWQNITSGASSTATFDTSVTGSKAVFVLSATASAVDQTLIIHLSVDAGI